MMNTASERIETSGDEDTSDKEQQEIHDDGPKLSDNSSSIQSEASSGITIDINNSNSAVQTETSSGTNTNCSNNSTGQSGVSTTPTTADSTTTAHESGSVQSGLSTGRPASSDNVPPAQSNVVFVKMPYTTRDSVPKSMSNAASKMNSLKDWGITRFKCMKQVLSEQRGSSSRSVDPELNAQIAAVRNTQTRYVQLSRVAEALTNHMYYVVQTQRLLGETFSDLAQTSPELQEEFVHNKNTQTFLAENGDTLLGALKTFTSSLNTLCDKTIEDTLMTVRQYETARLEYDAHPRSDVDDLILNTTADSANAHKVETAKKKREEHKVKLEKIKADLTVKLKLLEENKVQVMHKQLLQFHNAMCAYFTRFNIEPVNIAQKPISHSPSWLEQ